MKGPVEDTGLHRDLLLGSRDVTDKLYYKGPVLGSDLSHFPVKAPLLLNTQVS